MGHQLTTARRAAHLVPCSGPNNLKFTELVAQETLRHHPSVNHRNKSGTQAAVPNDQASACVLSQCEDELELQRLPGFSQ
jgi:hypothetical protein